MKNKLPNIVFIVIDALRADHLSCYGYYRKTSPNIDKLAKEGILFENVFTSSHGTDASITSIFSGKYPLSHGIIGHGNEVTPEQMREFNETGTLLLPEILKSLGYITIGIDWLGRWHKRGYDYYMGIKLKKSKIKRLLFYFLRKTQNMPITENAEYITSLSLKIIKKLKNSIKPFFLFIHYWDTHTPYRPPKRFENKFKERPARGVKIEEILEKIKNPLYREYMKTVTKGCDYVSDVVAKYDGAIAYVDSQIGRIMNFLEEENNLFKNTMVIITADHGESLGEHEIYFAHHELYDEVLRIPLIMNYYFQLPKETRIKSLVQNIDIAPTIFEMLKVDYSKFCLDGISLLSLLKKGCEVRSKIFAIDTLLEGKRTIRTENWKYIFTPFKDMRICRVCGYSHGETEELYDLKSDPKEQYNIAFKEEALTKKLREELFELEKSLKTKKEIQKRAQGNINCE